LQDSMCCIQWSLNIRLVTFTLFYNSRKLGEWSLTYINYIILLHKSYILLEECRVERRDVMRLSTRHNSADSVPPSRYIFLWLPCPILSYKCYIVFNMYCRYCKYDMIWDLFTLCNISLSKLAFPATKC
jgi:hypothetical protein